MLKKVKTVEKLVDAGVIAVVRGKDKTEACGLHIGSKGKPEKSVQGDQ